MLWRLWLLVWSEQASKGQGHLLSCCGQLKTSQLEKYKTTSLSHWRLTTPSSCTLGLDQMLNCWPNTRVQQESVDQTIMFTSSFRFALLAFPDAIWTKLGATIGRIVYHLAGQDSDICPRTKIAGAVEGQKARPLTATGIFLLTPSGFPSCLTHGLELFPWPPFHMVLSPLGINRGQRTMSKMGLPTWIRLDIRLNGKQQ